MGLFQKIFGQAQRAKSLPATEYGYLPPRDALAVGWYCTDNNCSSRLYYDQVQATVPHQCPTCGRPTTPVLAWPWHHYAERIRLDRLAAQAATKGDRVFGNEIYFNSLVWTYTDLLLQGRKNEASHSLDSLDKQLRTRTKKDPDFVEASHRYLAVLNALRTGHPDNAGAILSQWIDYASDSKPGYALPLAEDTATRTNFQELISAGLEWLESNQTQATATYDSILAAVCAIARKPHIVGYLGSSRLNRLRQLNPQWQTAP
jgi:hypothetical protein